MATFTDVPASGSLTPSINWVTKQGIMPGITSTQFRPGTTLTRVAAAETLYNLAGQPYHKPPATSRYPDVPASHAFYTAISWAVTKDLMRTWGDRTFRPTAALTREKAAEYLYRTASANFVAPSVSPFADVSTGRNNYREICWMYSLGLTAGSVRSGRRYFDPGASVPRDHWAAFLHRFDQKV